MHGLHTSHASSAAATAHASARCLHAASSSRARSLASSSCARATGVASCGARSTCSAMAMSAAPLGGRSRGAVCSSHRISASTAFGSVGTWRDGGTTSPLSTCCSTRIGEEPEKGSVPVTAA